MHIPLTNEEQSLFDAIALDTCGLDHLAVQANGQKVRDLFALLLKRDGIPKRRIEYFTRSEFNIGGHGKSHQEIFERNGCRGENIIRHPHFLPYFRYMVLGPDLPDFVIAEFASAVAGCGSVTSGDVLTLARSASKLAKFNRLDQSKAAEEFYKLALDLGMDSFGARSVRDKIRASK